ncbi:MAG: hydantoinase/oxoprolinase family protein [Oscillospiraceae bacterium]
MKLRLAVDTGGTFTDIVLMDEETGTVWTDKVPSTPDNPARACVTGTRRILEKAGASPEELTLYLHGTTVATNALLEYKGSPTALITTKGFSDIPDIARQTRPKLYDFRARKPKPLIDRDMRYELDERVLYDGSVLKTPDMADIEKIVLDIKKRGIESVAVCLLHSYANPVNENLIEDAFNRLYPECFVTYSAKVLPEYREYERMSTVSVNAYVMPNVGRYVVKLQDALKESGVNSELYVMQSNGGVISAQMAMEQSARTITSGPAGGVQAGLRVSRMTGIKNLITLDMGGTSTDVSLIENGNAQYTTETEIEGHPIKLPMINITTLGAGGGSIAWIDNGGALRVGPESAGAVPGPACYMRGGTRPTVTDANIVLGKLNPERILGGEMEVSRELAVKAIKEHIADPLGISVEEAAQGILRIVNANMIRGIRIVSVQQGYDPREFALVTFGGAASLHACDLADEMGMKTTVIPNHAGILSAMGMLTANVRHDYVRTQVTRDTMLDPKKAEALFGEMEARGREELSAESFTPDRMKFTRTADLRYAGQAYELSVTIEGGKAFDEDAKNEAVAAFHTMHERQYGYRCENEHVEFVNFRVIAQGLLPAVTATDAVAWGTGEKDLGTRKVYIDGEWIDTAIINRLGLRAGETVEGPAIIEQHDTTTLIPPKHIMRMDENANMIIERIEQEENGNEEG